ncbi:MAG: amino acid ABC transporter substrate-binding protein [Fusobacterium sp. JB021]|nr:amino acid ABC transporter substrate-binding protein [Fusobacterium sp. JB020]MDP0494140.1 amino acid ABC transporter substrate-binding protein [Fusobacterium sp. JB021]MDP0506228.1 amino acid ABC transporter substrate-binding protein [Fusobacterium sp. JB019]
MKKIIALIILVLGLYTVSFSKENSLARVKKEGKFIIGLDDTFAPMGFRDENGEIVGFDIDLAKETAKRMGVKVEFKPCEWDGILFELNGGKIDMVWNGMSITPAREKQASFSKPYYQGGQVIFTKKDNKISKVDQLAGKVVGLQLGSTGDYALQNSSVFTKVKKVKKYGTLVESLMDLEAGRLDAVIAASSAGGYYNSKNKTLAMSSESLLEGDGSGVAFRKKDVSLREEIDRIIDEMKRDGTYKKISVKWFGE